ncbi:MAG: hypothetical protein ACNFW9_03680 [Candidatus Kerfeldbacteria bacterium]|jgi:hypothetical protein
MSNISQPTIKFIDTFQQVSTQNQYDSDESKIKIQMTISRAASVYERIRNAIDYKDEHLLRKNAIERMLKRRFYTEDRKSNFGNLLITELIRAKYLPNNIVPERVIGEVENIIEKHLNLLRRVAPNLLTKERRKDANWILSVLATEIEHHLVPPTREDALVEYMYKIIRQDVDLAEDIVDPIERDLQVYIAIHRVLIKSDFGIIRFHLLDFLVPGWLSGDADAIERFYNEFSTIKDKIEYQINHPFYDRLFRFVRQFSVIFIILKDIIDEYKENFTGLVNHPKQFEQEIVRHCNLRYQKAKLKLKRSYIRTIIYIFITKMLLALALELPYELFILGLTFYTPLLVNIIFHPLLMLFIASSIKLPSEKNTQTITNLLMRIVYSEPHPGFLYRKKKVFNRSKVVEVVFNLLYALTFLLSFGVLVWALGLLNFNIVSIIFFIFFLTAVSFFGLKLRNEVKELVIVNERDSFFSALLNLFTLPILRVGQWLSAKVPKINVFLFIFDFIIEAPFKIFIEVVEDWITYQKEKKDEIY